MYNSNAWGIGKTLNGTEHMLLLWLTFPSHSGRYSLHRDIFSVCRILDPSQSFNFVNLRRRTSRRLLLYTWGYSMQDPAVSFYLSLNWAWLTRTLAQTLFSLPGLNLEHMNWQGLWVWLLRSAIVKKVWFHASEKQTGRATVQSSPCLLSKGTPSECV